MGYVTHDFRDPDGENSDPHFGAKYCVVETDRYFRSKNNFMKRAQAQGLGLLLVALPYSFHSRLLLIDKENHDKEIITDKTRAIFGTAERLEYLDHPYVRATFGREEDNLQDKEKIAVSYNLGARFVSWSGIVGHLAKHHLAFAGIFWSVVLYITANTFGWMEWACQMFPRVPMC